MIRLVLENYLVNKERKIHIFELLDLSIFQYSYTGLLGRSIQSKNVHNHSAFLISVPL